MSINVIISNSLDRLAENFSLKIRKEKNGVFFKDIVVTQTDGIKKWLSLSAAARNGIFANFEFFSPNELFSRLIFKMLNNHYEDSFYQKGNMKWFIYDILISGTFSKDSDFSELFDYCGGDCVKTMRLCNLTADLFDQYFIYREEMTASWCKGKNWDGIKDKNFKKYENWQKKLFIKLREKIQKAHESRVGNLVLHDRISLKNKLLRNLKNPDSDLAGNVRELKRISFFGLSVITDYHYEIISSLSNLIDCDFYLFNPSREYWYDIQSDKTVLRRFTKNTGEKPPPESENNFLAQYGRTGQEFFSILFRNEEALNNLTSDFDENFKQTLLGRVHKSLFNVTITPHSSDFDDSIRISSCYTPFREVEVLYDNLLQILERNSDIEPGDIVVMLTDVDKYAPYIEAVFQEKDKKNYIPFTISDKSLSGNDTPADTILQLLELTRGAGEAEEVMALVENRYISRKFGFTSTSGIRDIIRAASIRWGLNRNQIERNGVLEYNIYQSWEYGLKRIVYGYAIQGEPETEGLLPVDTVEGTEALDGLRLYGLIKEINSFFDSTRKARSLVDWKTFFMEIFDKFILLDRDEEKERDEFDKLMIYWENKDLNVPFSVIRDDLILQCASTRSGGGFYTGGITFCSMTPMRSVPHKVIALLGMDEESFPGKQQSVTFNLMEEKRKVGDRDHRLSNRYLFLESLISAERYYYLSYVGRSSKTGKELNPSCAVSDLLQFIADISLCSREDVKNRLTTEYPLHGYGNKYINGELDTYIKNNDISPEHKMLQFSERTNDTDSAQMDLPVSISCLIWFFKNPVKWYCNNVLKIYYEENELLLKGEEAFETEGLDRWLLKSRLVKSGHAAVVRMQKFEGILPPGTPGQVIAQKTESEIESVISAWRKQTDGRDIKLVFAGYNNIEGEIECFDNRFVSCSVSSNNGKYLLEHYIKHLFLQAWGFKGDSVFIDSGGREIAFSRISKKYASKNIDRLTNVFMNNKNRPVPFEINLAFSYRNSSRQGIDKLNELWNSFKYGGWITPGDEYASRIFPDFEFDETTIKDFENLLTITVDAINDITGGIHE